MSTQTKFLLAVFYLCAFLALFAPMVLADHNGTFHPTGNVTNTNSTSIYPTNTPSTTTPSNAAVAVHFSSSVALFGALVAAAFFTI